MTPAVLTAVVVMVIVLTIVVNAGRLRADPDSALMSSPWRHFKYVIRLDCEFMLDVAFKDASWVCCNAIAKMHWAVEEVEADRMVAQIGFGLTRNYSRIEVLLAEAGDSQTKVTLNGSIEGIGPLQELHLDGEINKLRNAIEVSARDAQPV